MKKQRFFRKVLGNGMTVLFEERKHTGVVSVGFAIKAGGCNEAEAEKGISHFIEHMLYKGTDKRDSKKISEEIEKNGGILNGFTDEELTAYWCKMPSKHLDVALDVLGDMVRNPKFDETEIDKERLVIFEEMKMRKDNPSVYVMDKIQSMLYSGDFAFSLVGTEKSMSSIGKKELVDKFHKLYCTENLLLCVVGDANFKTLCNFCEKNFRKFAGKIPERKIILANRHAVEKRKGIDQANLLFSYHVPKANEEKSYAAQVLNCILAGGMSSRLFQEIREKRNLAYAVRGSSTCAKRFGYNSIHVGTSKDRIKQIENLIVIEIKKFVKSGDEKELREAKEQLMGNSRISREDSQGQMIDLIYNEIWGKAEQSYEYEKQISQVKLSDVKEIAKQAIKNYSFLALIPE
jgi:predicted Zn-dependent peptidase